MKKQDIKVGGRYLAKVNNKIVTVRVDAIRETGADWHNPNGRSVTRYDVTNLETGRATTFRSAAKFQREAEPESPMRPAGSVIRPGGMPLD